jgi:two-component system copper resistance phosphate regulon response regulator CusR
MKILLIEDDPKVSRILSTGLTSERFLVDVAADGVEGLHLATFEVYSLIILDLMLPLIDGTEVIRRLRAAKVEVPILVLTAKDAIADKVENFELGADDYLTKPFNFAELVVRVKSLLRRGQTSRSNQLVVGNLVIDRMSRQAKRGSQVVKLTSREFELLEYLALNAGKIISRSMIIEHVWDQSFEGLTNIVDVYIRQLRGKMDDHFPTKLIHTVRGMGYYLSEKELWD